MNREIKFRAWDKVGNYWLHASGALDKDQESSGKGQWRLRLENPNIELMQYTGLKDKNGKEIYEGDIIKAESGMGEYLIAEVDYCELVGSMGRLKEIGTNHLEIIGNIYEHPDILSTPNPKE